MNPLINPACELPDLPRWVAARAAVLSGECDIFGMPGQDSCIIRSTRLPLATVVGRPSTELLLRSIDLIGNNVELLVMHEDAEHVRRVLRYWRELPATLHTRPAGCVSVTPDGDGVRIYDPWVPRGKRGFADQLKHEVRAARVVAARRVDGQVVSVCHTGAITETLWDVGVDTLCEHRRQGHARACFAALDRHMCSSNRQPVWGLLDTNVASLALAASLGFEPVDRLSVFLSPNRTS